MDYDQRSADVNEVDLTNMKNIKVGFTLYKLSLEIVV